MTDTGARYADYAGNAGFWVDIIRRRRDRYREQLTNGAVLDAVGAVSGLHVLDLACGEGYMSRLLAGAGAKVAGIDIAVELITAARDLEATEPLGVQFEIGSAYDLPFGDGTFDLVLANHAFNSLEDLDRAAAEIFRVLRPGGRLVALCLHPCFTGMDLSDRAWPGRYFTARAKEHRFLVDGEQAPDIVVGFHRPLEAYVAALVGSGLAITGLTEPHPSEEQLADPWWQQWWDRPMFMIFTAEKRCS